MANGSSGPVIWPGRLTSGSSMKAYDRLHVARVGKGVDDVYRIELVPMVGEQTDVATE